MTEHLIEKVGERDVKSNDSIHVIVYKLTSGRSGKTYYPKFVEVGGATHLFCNCDGFYHHKIHTFPHLVPNGVSYKVVGELCEHLRAIVDKMLSEVGLKSRKD